MSAETPEQLVREYLDFSAGPPSEMKLVRAGDLRVLAVALFDCLERERQFLGVVEAAKDVLDYESSPRRSALSNLRAALAQPPSEPSPERSTS